jgi:hypothetical protein
MHKQGMINSEVVSYVYLTYMNSAVGTHQKKLINEVK